MENEKQLPPKKRKRTYKKWFTVTEVMSERIIAFEKKTGLKETELFKLSIDAYLNENGFTKK